MFEVNEEVINICKEAFTRFIGNGLYVGLFFMSILYIIVNMQKEDKKENKIRIVLCVYSIIVLILNLSPVFAKWIINILNEDVTYWRVYWILPLAISIAFMFTEIIFKKEKLKDKGILFVLIIAIIVVSGSYMYNSDDEEKFVKVNNYYKVPDNVLDIVQKVSEDKSDYKKLAGTSAFIIYTRQIDGTILLPEGRTMSGEYNPQSIVTIIHKGDLKAICDYCTAYKCNYLVLEKGKEFPKEYILGYDIKKMYENKEYSLYKFNRIVDK